MAQIRPFRAIHPIQDLQNIFPVTTISNLSKNQVQDLENSNLENYVKMIDLSAFSTRISKKKVYQQIREDFQKLIGANKLNQEPSALYIYEITLNNNKQFKGIICLTSINEFNSNKIKNCHKICDNKVKTLTKFLNQTGIQAEPILLSHSENSKLNVLIEHEIKGRTLLNFTDKYQIKHRIWKIENALKISQFRDALKYSDSLYVIDGINRLEAAKNNAKLMKKIDTDYTGNEPYNYVLSYLIPANLLAFYDYITLVKSLKDMSKSEFLNKLNTHFNVIKKGQITYYPSQKYHISMFLDGEFYSLYIKKEFRSIPKGLGDIDAYLLESLILKPILNIEKNPDNFEFIKGNGTIQSAKLLREKVESNQFKLGFSILPVSFNDIKQISELKQKISNETFYHQPKLLTGLFMLDVL